MDISKRNLIEHETGDLYSDCFSRLNFSQRHLEFQGRLLASQLALNKENVAGKICLDGGCGHGTLSYQMLKLGAKKVYGADLKPTPNQEVFRSFDNIRFVECSLLNLPFENNFFDLVASTGVIHHTVDPERAFSEMARALKPGGRMVLGVYGKHGLFPYCLWVARLFTIKIPLISRKFASKIIDSSKLSAMTRYQLIDYLFVPMLERFSPGEVKNMFLKYGFKNPERILNVSPEEATSFRRQGTVYTYDPRSFLSKILFGYGFITVAGEKPRF